MAVQVPLHIRQRLAEVVGDLKNAVGQQAGISSEEPLEVEPGAEPCDDSWMEFIHEECIIDASNPTPSPSYRNIQESRLQTAYPQTDADMSCPGSLPQIACPETSDRSITEEVCCKHSHKSNTHHERPTSKDDTLEKLVERIPRRNLLDCLAIYWEALKMEGIYAMPSRQVFPWTLKGTSQQVRRLHYHLILRHLDVEHDFYQWRRAIAELRNLEGYMSFLAEAQAEQTTGQKKRQRGETNSKKAHKEYLAHIYADRTPRDYQRIKQALKKDLRHGRRWSILVDGFLAHNGDTISGLGSGLLLLCGPALATKM